MTEQILEVEIVDLWDQTSYTEYAHIEGDILILNGTGTSLTDNLERAYNVTLSLKLKSDKNTVIGEIMQLMEVPPKEIRNSLQNC